MVDQIYKASQVLKGVVRATPLEFKAGISERLGCTLHVKREDLQAVRSYKIRGAYNKMSSLSPKEKAKGVVTVSAGNHAQGVAYACAKLKIHGTIFMPRATPHQKVRKVRHFGKEWVDIKLEGDTFDDACFLALDMAKTGRHQVIHPFNDPMVIAGQGTVGLEILQDSDGPIDYVFAPIGGGGLVSGLGSIFKKLSPKTKIIGVEPAGAPAMYQSLQAGERIKLDQMDTFVDGAAVREVGTRTFRICKEVIDDMVLVPEGKVCSTILNLYNEEGIVVEPAGALAIAALELFKGDLRDKRVVAILSGSNNDITRTEEIKERALLYEGLKHYFIIRFPQRSGALRDFLNQILGPTDDITHFEYTKRHNRANGPALVGIQVQNTEDYHQLVDRMQQSKVAYADLNSNPMLFDLFL